MRVNHNINALNAWRNSSMTVSAMGKTLEKLSSGFRINRAGDDAAGLAISEKMRAQIKGLDQASRNAQDSISLIQTTEGALNETHSILQRMRELAVQASNDTNVTVDRDEIQKEINQLTSEINRIGNTTEFNTMKLLDGSKANTETTTTGNYGDTSGGLTAAVASLGGVGQVTFDSTAALASGEVTVQFTRTAEDIANASGSIAAKVSGTTGQNLGSAFVGNKIYVSGAANQYWSGNADGIKISYDDTAQTLTVISSGLSGGINDTVALVSGKVDYDNLGVKFSFDASGLSGANGTINFDTSGAGTAFSNIDTFTDKYVNLGAGAKAAFVDGSTVQVSQATTEANYSGKLYHPDEKMTWTIELRGASGLSGFRLSGVSADGATSIVDQVDVNISGAAYTYSGYGLTFKVSGADGMAAGAGFQFTVDPTFTFNGSVTDTSGTATFNVASGVNQSGLASGSYAVSGGMTFDVSGNGGVISIAEGSSTASGTFNVYASHTTGTDNSMYFQIGANQNQALALDISDMRADAINVSVTASSGDTGNWIELSRAYEDLSGTADYSASGGKYYVKAYFVDTESVSNGTDNTKIQYSLDMSTHTKAKVAVTVINDAIERVSAERSKLGATQNRLEHTIANLGVSSENLTAAESRIRDADMAAEMMKFTKEQIIMQSANAMLSQANQLPQNVLQLLR